MKQLLSAAVDSFLFEFQNSVSEGRCSLYLKPVMGQAAVEYFETKLYCHTVPEGIEDVSHQ